MRDHEVVTALLLVLWIALRVWRWRCTQCRAGRRRPAQEPSDGR